PRSRVHRGRRGPASELRGCADRAAFLATPSSTSRTPVFRLQAFVKYYILTSQYVHSLRHSRLACVPVGNAHARAQAGALPARRRAHSPAPAGGPATWIR